MWNERYSPPEYAYGKRPNIFFAENLNVFANNAHILFAAEGEGRNAVYAASKGFRVKCFDFSIEAKNKALTLAKEKGVEIDYEVTDLLSYKAETELFDGLVLIYAHFPPSNRQLIHRKLQKLLRPGGAFILEAFSKNHLMVSKNNKKTSGPQNIELLYNTQTLQEDFDEIRFSRAQESIEILDEGPYHQGKSSLIRMIGKKK